MEMLGKQSVYYPLDGLWKMALLQILQGLLQLQSHCANSQLALRYGAAEGTNSRYKDTVLCSWQKGFAPSCSG